MSSEENQQDIEDLIVNYNDLVHKVSSQIQYLESALQNNENRS